jgi:small ligand-binding sensory domain FIST
MLGLYVSCVGRQRSLYGESDAELRMIRKRFPKLPLAGLFAPQQLVPVEGGAELRYMASVLALFRAPS